MTQDNVRAGGASTQNNVAGSPPNQLPPGKAPPGAKPPTASSGNPKKRRWALLLWIGGACAVLLILFVLLLPTLLGFGFVREMVLSEINGSVINGKLEIKDWSFGWTSGVHIEGISLRDQTGDIHMVDVGVVDIPISLLKAASGNIDIGEATISGVDVNAVLDTDGQLNLAKVLKPSNKPPSNAPTKLPNVKGVLHIKDVHGTFDDKVHHLVAGIEPLDGTVTILDINQPIQDSFTVKTRLGEKDLGGFQIDGSIGVVQNNLLDINQAAVKQTIDISNFDLASANSALAGHGLTISTTGVTNGKITLNVDTLDKLSVNGALASSNISVTTGGDTIAYQAINTSIDASTAGATGNIKAAILVNAQPGGARQASTNQPDKIAVNADVPQDALLDSVKVLQAIAARLTAKAPAQPVTIANGNGTISVTASLDVANVVRQAPHLVHLQQGTSISTGMLTDDTEMTIADQKAVISSKTELANFAGTNAGKPVSLQDINFSLGAEAAGGDKPDLTNIQLDLSSSIFNFKGGGATLSQLNFSGDEDLKNIKEQAGQFIDLPFDARGTLAINAHTKGDPTGSSIEFGAGIDGKDISVTLPGKQPATEAALTAAIGGTVQSSDNSISATIPTLDFALGDQLSLGVDPQKPIQVSMTPGGGNISASGAVQLVKADLAGLVGLALPELPADEAVQIGQLKSGTATGTFALSNKNGGIGVNGDLTVAGLTYGPKLNNENVHVLASADVSSDLSAVNNGSLTVETSFAKQIAITNVGLALKEQQDGKMVAVAPVNMLQSADVHVDSFDVAKGYAFVAPTAAIGPDYPSTNILAGVVETGSASKSLDVRSGLATLDVNISRNNDLVTAKVQNVDVKNFAVKTGDYVYSSPQDITANLSADVKTQGDTFLGVSVTALKADLGVTHVELMDGKPINISRLGDPSQMTADGGVVIDGDIAAAMRLAEAFTGVKANSYPYAGHYHFPEEIAKQPGSPRLRLVGGGTITNFQVLAASGQAGAAPVFAEPEIDIQNGLDYDPGTSSIFIDHANPVSVNLKSTGALAVTLTGTVHDLLGARQIDPSDNLVVTLSYDLAKDWPILKPMLSAAQQQKFSDMVISGVQKRTITVAGSYPANTSFGTAVAYLQANGAVGVDSVATQGITVTSLEVPFVLGGGIFQTVYAGQPVGSNAPKPASCNGGLINLGVISVDVRTDPMLMNWVGVDPTHPLALLGNIQINPAVQKTILSKFLNNPAFATGSASQGLLSLNVLQCQNVPLSDLMLQSSPANKSFFETQYSLTGLQMGNELFAVLGNSSVSGDIKNADVKIAAGRVTEDSTLMIDGNKPFRLAGVVVLSTEQFAPMTAYIATSLLGNLIPNNVVQYVPDQIVVPMTGDMTKPKLDLSKAIGQAVADAGKKALINGLLGGNGQQGNSNGNGGDIGGQQQPDPLGDLLKGLTKKKK